jgi:RNA polymerase sigma-70 factor (TIGR02960 family)
LNGHDNHLIPAGWEFVMDPLGAAFRNGDETALNALVERHRRELHVHCYRMLGSYGDAEDAVQETFVRAWRAHATFDGGPHARAWLYRIATNTCLDAIRRTKRQVRSLGSFAEVPWLTPYPDRMLDLVAPAADEPHAVAVARETVELAYIAVIQLLPARQRAVLLLRDVLDWSANETAAALEISVPAANSALQRARATLREQLPDREAPSRVDLTADERALLMRYIAAHESGNVEEAVSLMREDIRVTMPPNPWLFDGITAVAELMSAGTGTTGPGEWTVRPTSANRMPAAACYLREPGAERARIFKFDVIRFVDGRIAEITTFGPGLAEQFGVPEYL